MRSTQVAAIIAAVVLCACGKDDKPSNNTNNSMSTDTGSTISDTGTEADTGGMTPDSGTVDMGGPPEDMTTAPDMQADLGVDMGTAGFSDPAISSGTRLRARYIEGGEGADVALGFWDTDLMTACSFRTAKDATLRCLPPAKQSIWFSDPSCSQPVAVTGADICDTPWRGSSVDATVYRKTSTPAVLSGAIYYRSDTSCVMDFVDASEEYWVADVVPSAQFVAGTYEDAQRADDMIARTIVGDDGSRILARSVHRTRGYDCTFDENQRCVPDVETSGGVFYADAGCTQAVHGFYGATTPPLVALDVRDADLCVISTQYFETGAAFTGPTMYAKNPTSGLCTVTPMSAMYSYFYRGNLVPLTELPLATSRLEGTGALQARRFVDSNGDPLGTADLFWDTTRDEFCSGSELADGSLACMPTLLGGLNSQYHLDPACANPSAIGFATCAPAAPRLLVQLGNPSCVEPTFNVFSDVFERGASLGRDIYFDNGTTCTARTLPAQVDVWSTGADATSTLPALQILVDEP